MFWESEATDVCVFVSSPTLCQGTFCRDCTVLLKQQLDQEKS